MSENKETKDEVQERIDAVEKKADAAAAMSRKIQSVLERVFGIDIDKDGKVGRSSIAAVVALFGLCAVLAYAAENYVKYGTLDYWSEASLTVGGNATVTSNLTVSGTASLANLNVTGTLTSTNLTSTSVVPYTGISNALFLGIAKLTVTNAVGDIPVAPLTNAAGSLGAWIGGNVPVAAITNALTTGGGSVGGNIPIAAVTNAVASLSGTTPIAATAITNAIVGTIQPAYAYGKFSVVSSTQLVFIANGVTNVLDSDITN